MVIRMGYWDCTACGARRIEGPERQCAACGQPRSAEVRFYTDAESKEVEDDELLARARAGADWHCPYCGADNRAGATGCVGCGASTEGARSREQHVRLDAPPPAAPRSRASLAKLALVALAVLVGVYLAFFRTSDHRVEVLQKTWTKTVVLEALRTVTDEAWSDELPSGARELERFSRMRQERVQDGVERVKIGQKDLGNGFFEDVYEERPRYVTRDVPATRVRYQLDRWERERELEESRGDGSEPPWPRASLGPRLREGAKKSEISLELADDGGKRYRYSVSADEGVGFVPGKRYVAEINAVGVVRALR